MAKRPDPVLIGDLLVKSELVSLGQFADAMPISLTTGLPVGRVLVGSGYLKESHFKAAVSAQSLIRENLLHLDLALSALKLVGQYNVTLDEALKRLGWRSEYYETTNRLGDLLVDAGLVEVSVVNDCLDDCFASGLPLGRVLVMKGAVNEMLTYAALTAQILIRENHINRDQAIEALKLAARRKMTIEESLNLSGIAIVSKTHAIRLGELLILADLVSEIDLLSAVERGLLDEQPIGQVLVRVGLITENTLKQALQLQEMVTEGQVRPLIAAKALKAARRAGKSLAAALKEVGDDDSDLYSKMELPELFRNVGLIGQSDMIKAIDFSSTTDAPFAEVVWRLRLVDQSTIEAAVRCHELYKADQISAEQCIFALQSFLGSRRNIDELLGQVGWQGGR
ncbi:MAG: hypothetical protein AB7W16_24490 [Candidatus Obscuribacterales bacterium]